jgi:hypothetical protein
VKSSILLLSLLITGCAGLPNYTEPPTNIPLAKLKVTSNFDAPFLGYSTFVNVHTEENTCGKSFGSKSAARLIVLDVGNPLISELNPNGVKLPVGSKYSFMIMSVAGMSNCTIFASFNPKAGQNYEIKTSGQLGSLGSNCKAELYSYDKTTNVKVPVDFEYYGQCRELKE